MFDLWNKNNEIITKLEKEFDVEFDVMDNNVISIYYSNFEYGMIEYIEDEFNLNVEFEYVTDGSTFVEITVNKETKVDEIYKQMQDILYQSGLIYNDKLHICNKLVSRLVME